MGYALYIYFNQPRLTPESFSPGAFDGTKKDDTNIHFYKNSIDYLPEKVFRSFLDQKIKNIIKLGYWSDKPLSYIDYADCRNY